VTDLTYTAALVLHAIHSGRRYGFQVMDGAGLPSGTVYPALRKLEKSGLIRSQWEKESVARAEQRPARRYYQVTRAGETALSDAGEKYRFPQMEGQPAER
jgi:PadR family transcriptional regulator, regulatory protein PadR